LLRSATATTRLNKDEAYLSQKQRPKVLLPQKERFLALLLLLAILFWGVVLFQEGRFARLPALAHKIRKDLPKEEPVRKRGEGEIVIYVQGDLSTSGTYYVRKGATLRALVEENKEVFSGYLLSEERLQTELKDHQVIWLK